MKKAEMLKKQAKINTNQVIDIYVSNQSEIKKESVQSTIQQNKEPVQSIKESNTIINNKQKEEDLKMLSFRLPQKIINNIDKYAYVQRMKKQDAIIMAFESFFKNNKVQDILKQYDEIIENQK